MSQAIVALGCRCPDIANPTGIFFSAAMLLEWLGERQGSDKLLQEAQGIEDAVDGVFGQAKVRPADIGGNDGTGAITRDVVDALR